MNHTDKGVIFDAIVFKETVRLYDRDACSGCGSCVDACAFDAVELCGRTISAETLWEEVRDDRAFWDRSGGGITLSGGEPLVQIQFVRHFLELCKRHRVHTAVETCGAVPEENFTRILDLVDFVLFDVKLTESAGHKANTGVSNHLIAKNLAALVSSSKQGLIRIPLIPGINDTPDVLEQMSRFLSRKGGGLGIELLPYHRLGEKKYEKLRRPYPLTSVVPPTPDQVEAVGKTLAKYGLRLILPEVAHS